MADDNNNNLIPETDAEKKVRLLADWGFLLCAGIFSMILFGGGLYHLFVVKQPWLVEILQHQFAALIIPPMTMVSAMIVVISLKVMSGPMKFKILGFEFEGSSAPIIMWILVYLVMIHSVTLLWVDPAITQNITTLVK